MQELKTGEIIRELRKSKNITQEKLAEILGITSAAVSKWESGITYPDLQKCFLSLTMFPMPMMASRL